MLGAAGADKDGATGAKQPLFTPHLRMVTLRLCSLDVKLGQTRTKPIKLEQPLFLCIYIRLATSTGLARDQD
jgi:hypothetical protein